jgi:catechol 2,3-dioxygenase-like lactoylglutathione lyase family enzyme
MRRAKLNQTIPILDVRSVEDALRFYVDRLGFEVEFRYEADPDNYAGVYRDNVFLHMQWQDHEHFASGGAGQARIRIIVDDPDSLYSEFRNNGALPDGVVVRDTAWGTREFGFRDPDGNGLSFYRDR